MKKKYLLFFIIILSSCVYYNTFFNAKKYFKNAQEIPLINGKVKPQAKTKYTQAMKKCGIVLTEYKNSKYADDALFMLAQCMYYIGSNYVQAKEKFHELITFYPESPFVAESHIFIAKIKFQQNKKEEAFSLLNNFIANPKFKVKHTQALLLIANEHSKRKNYVQAANSLEKLITDYTKSKDVPKAHLILGEILHKSENYQQSNETLSKLLKFRVHKKIKSEARYFIALNYLLLENYDSAIKTSKILLLNQYDETDIAKTNLIIARCLIGKGNYSEAGKKFLHIIENSKKTSFSAEACFYLAEMYFKKSNDYENAITYYNMVKKEFNKSEFVEKSILRSSICSQILQYRESHSNISTQNLMEQHFKLAEYYIQELNYPDSALVIYNEIIQNESLFVAKLDSLSQKLETQKNDFLNMIPEYHKISDTLQVIYSNIQTDSLVADSLKNALSVFLNDYNRISTEREQISSNYKLYNTKYLPFANFTKIWVYKILLKDLDKAKEILQNMKIKYPDNRYYYAAQQLLNNEKIEFATPQEIIEKQDYQEAIASMKDDPQLSVSKLSKISQNPDNQFYAKTLYSLGYINYFLLSDSISAKTYFNRLIDEKITERDILLSLSKFYDGENFKSADSLQTLQRLKKSAEEQNIKGKNIENIEPEIEKEELKEKLFEADNLEEIELYIPPEEEKETIEDSTSE